jgi:hypothetical protein
MVSSPLTTPTRELVALVRVIKLRDVSVPRRCAAHLFRAVPGDLWLRTVRPPPPSLELS